MVTFNRPYCFTATVATCTVLNATLMVAEGPITGTTIAAGQKDLDPGHRPDRCQLLVGALVQRRSAGRAVQQHQV
jgi:hypothetical protein